MATRRSKPAAPFGPDAEPLSESADTKSSLATDASPSSPEVLRTLYSALLKTRLLEEQVLSLSRAGKIPGVAPPSWAAKPPKSGHASVLSLKTASPPRLRTLYSALLKTRLLEERVLTLSRAGKIPGVALPILGGEATEVGACIGLQPEDSLATSQPKLAAHVVKDTQLHRVFAELFARHKQPPPQHTSNGAGALRIIPPASSVTGQLDIAAGVAYAYRSLGKANVVVALADDGLAALGFWHEAASLASRHRLPIVFIVENCAQSQANGTSVIQSDEDLRDRAEAYGIPGITVDGNDIVAVWRVTQESIHRARTGAGATLIECRTWRWHAETDKSSTNGRSKSKPAYWQHDPLQRMEHYMKKRKLWQQAWKDRLVNEYQGALAVAVNSLQQVSKSR